MQDFRRNMQFLFTLLISCFFSNNCFAQGFGNGSAGSTNISGIVNAYTAVVAIDNSATSYTTLTLDTTSVFSTDDLALIIQMQGAQIDSSNTSSYGSVMNYKNAGNYEYVKILSVSGSQVHTTKISKTYDVSGHMQLIKVPQYANVTVNSLVTVKPWNGTKGGVVAIDATGTITLNADIDASGAGFHGGTPKSDGLYSNDDTDYFAVSTRSGMKGEGIAGWGDYTGLAIYGRGKVANGGGGGNNHNAGGGGGANVGCGGYGGWGYYSYLQPNSRGIGGTALLSQINLNRIYLGGGGGAGQANDHYLSNPGNGGGIVILTANVLTGNGHNIKADGTTASDNLGYDGSSGGGAGGSILLHLISFNNVYTSCKGGNGGNPTNFMGIHLQAPGGGGGGGLIWIKNISAGTGFTYSLDSGNAGKCDTSAFGATAGCSGSLLQSLVIPHFPVAIHTVETGSFVVSIYPNPANNYLEIFLPESNSTACHLSIFDVKGTEIYKTIFEDNHEIIDIRSWQPGIYFLKISNNEGASVSRFVK